MASTRVREPGNEITLDSLRRVRTRPDVLVLGGGGVLGEAWMMGVLAGIEDGAGLDLRQCESFVGTSAGSIVAAHLVAGNSPRRPSSVVGRARGRVRRAGAGLARAGALAIRSAGQTAVAASSTFAPLALGASAPGGALVRSLLLRASAAAGRDARFAACAGRGHRGPVRRPAAGRRRRSGLGSPGRVRPPRRAGRHRRRRGHGVLHRPVAVRADRRSAAASTSTAASGAPPTSTPLRPAATPRCCA